MYQKLPAAQPWRGGKFGILPEDILLRRDLSAACKVMLAGIGVTAGGTGVTQAGISELGQICGMSRLSVRRCLDSLEGAGLIYRQKNWILILHPRYRNKKRLPGKTDYPPEKKEESQQHEITCARCGKKRPKLLRSGICRSCNWEIKVRKIAREEIAARREN
jgi:ribosomal protein S14